MSAPTGIEASETLTTEFASAVASQKIRFVKVSIQNESLVHDRSVSAEGTLLEDLKLLQDPSLLEDNVPAYILARQDESTDWLVIYYVPETAKIRDKMLYAATRSSLMRALGSTTFTDSIFATSKEDITPEGYLAHRKHVSAPKPLSAAEQEMQDVKNAERAAGNSTYQGSSARVNHVGNAVGFAWSQEAEDAVNSLAQGDDCRIIILTVDSKENLILQSDSTTSVEELGGAFPQDSPCYAFFAWPHSYTSPPRRELVYIYSCPLPSTVKPRMVYSNGFLSTYMAAEKILPTLSKRKVQTSDPTELNESFLVADLELDDKSVRGDAQPSSSSETQKQPFAKPKGPGRRR